MHFVTTKATWVGKLSCQGAVGVSNVSFDPLNSTKDRILLRILRIFKDAHVYPQRHFSTHNPMCPLLFQQSNRTRPACSIAFSLNASEDSWLASAESDFLNPMTLASFLISYWLLKCCIRPRDYPICMPNGFNYYSNPTFRPPLSWTLI